MDIEARIRDVILAKVNRSGLADTLTYETPLLQLGIDSILALSILVQLENEFEFEIDDDDLNLDIIKNIKAFADYIRSRRGATGG